MASRIRWLAVTLGLGGLAAAASELTPPRPLFPSANASNSAPGLQQGASADSCGPGAWLVYTDDRRNSHHPDVEALFLSLDGGALNPIARALDRSPLAQSLPAVRCSQSQCLATWVHSQFEVRAARLDCLGNVLDATPLRLSYDLGSEITEAAVGWHTNGWTLAVIRGFAQIDAATFDRSLNVTNAETTIYPSVAGEAVSDLSIAPQGAGQLVAFQRGNGTGEQVVVGRLNIGAGSLSASGLRTVASFPAYTRAIPHTCGDTTGSMAVWFEPNGTVRVETQTNLGAVAGMPLLQTGGATYDPGTTALGPGGNCHVLAPSSAQLEAALVPLPLSMSSQANFSAWPGMPRGFNPAFAVGASASVAFYSPYLSSNILFSSSPLNLGGTANVDLIVGQGGAVHRLAAAASFADGTLVAFENDLGNRREVLWGVLDPSGAIARPVQRFASSQTGLDPDAGTALPTVSVSNQRACLGVTSAVGVRVGCASTQDFNFSGTEPLGTQAADSLRLATLVGGGFAAWTVFSGGTQVHGTRLGNAGTPLDGLDHVLVPQASVEVQLCADASRFWLLSDESPGLQLREFAPGVPASVKAGTRVPTGLFPTRGSLACSSSGGLVLWSEAITPSDEGIFAAAFALGAGMQPQFGPVLPMLFPLANAPGATRDVWPRASFDGTAYRVVVQTPAADSGSDILMRTVYLDGGLGPLHTLAQSAAEEGEPAVTSFNGATTILYRVGDATGSHLEFRQYFERPDLASCAADSWCMGGACRFNTCCNLALGNCPDAGTADAGVPDAGAPDSGTDAGAIADAGSDAGQSDGGVSDAGFSDGGPQGGAPVALRVACGCSASGLAPLLCLAIGLLRRRQRTEHCARQRGACAVSGTRWAARLTPRVVRV